MTIIIPGSNSTLKSDTAEGQLLEAVTFAKNLENNPSKNPTSANRINGSFDISINQFTATLQIPMTPSINGDGQTVSIAANYLQNTGFSNDGSGTFKSQTIEAILLEICTYLQILESNPTKNPNQNNNITLTYDYDNGVMDGNVTIPILLERSEQGSIQISADEYLLD